MAHKHFTPQELFLSGSFAGMSEQQFYFALKAGEILSTLDEEET